MIFISKRDQVLTSHCFLLMESTHSQTFFVGISLFLLLQYGYMAINLVSSETKVCHVDRGFTFLACYTN